MKFYQILYLVLLLSTQMRAEVFWSKWIDTISSKINNITDLILHKEFAHAKKLELHNHTGNIVINSWKQNSIAIEVIISAQQTSQKNISVDMECIEEIIKIHTSFIDEKIKGSVHFNILVPKNIEILLASQHGDIIIKDVEKKIEVSTDNGTIKIVNPHDSVNASTKNGTIIIRTDAIHENEIFTISSQKGDIEFYTTQAINTYIHAYAPQGKIFSDLLITLDSQTTYLNSESWKNFKKNVHGIIGEPLSQLHMNAENGSIFIMPSIKQNDIF